MHSHHCRNGHPIRGPRDLRSNRQCVLCSRRNESEYRRRCRDARRRLAAIEALIA
jgi:hypothetical protein